MKASVCFNLFADETGSICTYMAPDHHYLEAWNDYEPFAGRIDLAQPIINPLYNTRAAQENFLRWSDNTSSYYDFVRQTHNGAYTAAAMKTDASWNQSVHNGTMSAAPVVAAAVVPVAPVDSAATPAAPAVAEVAPSLAAPDVNAALGKISSVQSGNWELSLYQKVTMGAGMHANNAMLNETPDPITKVTWDNYVTMAAADMEEMGLQTYIGQCDCASLVTVTVGGKSLTLPAFPTPGQKRKTIGIALRDMAAGKEMRR